MEVLAGSGYVGSTGEAWTGDGYLVDDAAPQNIPGTGGLVRNLWYEGAKKVILQTP